MNSDSEKIVQRIEETLLTYCRQQGLFKSGDRVIAACSGGADSMALLLFLLRRRRDLEIEVLAVAPGHRGRGVGSDLLSRIEQAGREHGCRYALLNTFDFQGRDFHPKYGYRQIGEIQGYPLTGSQHWFVKDRR